MLGPVSTQSCSLISRKMVKVRLFIRHCRKGGRMQESVRGREREREREREEERERERERRKDEKGEIEKQ